jgi:hypothetical protein
VNSFVNIIGEIVVKVCHKNTPNSVNFEEIDLKSLQGFFIFNIEF